MVESWRSDGRTGNGRITAVTLPAMATIACLPKAEADERDLGNGGRRYWSNKTGQTRQVKQDWSNLRDLDEGDLGEGGPLSPTGHSRWFEPMSPAIPLVK